jgi:hypothetical protein
MLSNPWREPDCDITAQIGALCDPAHPKIAVYLCPENPAPYLDVPGVYRSERPEGVLFTTDKAKAQTFQSANLSDDIMAALLGYPETKAEVMASGLPVAVQARNANGDVITEAAASIPRLSETVNKLSAHVPPGGSLSIVSVVDALARRIILCRNQNA